jgi:hypothetical protein
MIKKQVNINEIVIGDTVEHNGEMLTVCPSSIKENKFWGKSIFGDSYNSGSKKVTKIIFSRFFKGKLQ